MIAVMYDAETIRGWIIKAELEIAELVSEAESIQRQIAEARRQLMLLYELLASVTNSPVDVSTDLMGIGVSVRDRVLSNAEDILREHGRPMHIQDIHAAFIHRRMPLPGRGTPTNIAAHIAASQQFARWGRGIYGLSEWKEGKHISHSDTPTLGMAEGEGWARSNKEA
jgi:hypothetical protein